MKEVEKHMYIIIAFVKQMKTKDPQNHYTDAYEYNDFMNTKEKYGRLPTKLLTWVMRRCK